MKKELNYPIKYAVLELKEHGGWEHNYEDITVGFIVSPCYVINQNTRYYSDGTNKTTYQVVFPYKDIHTYKYRNIFNEKTDTPHYSLYKICLNCNEVSDIFDTYEKASIAAEKANTNKRKSIFCRVSEYQNLLNKHNENLEICKRFEQLILERTANMSITKDDISIKKLTRKKEQQ